jgi:tetratricopeptide (TPR) repeat protein
LSLIAAWLGMHVALAAVPLPSYRRAVATSAWLDINERLETSCTFDGSSAAMICDANIDLVAQRAQAFTHQAFEDAGIVYLLALTHRYQGRNQEAEQAYRRSLALDAEYDAAWHDLGELLLLTERYDEATAAFLRVAELRSEGPNAWVGPWRLAEVAAERHDPRTFEGHMREALSRGFSFRQIAGLPNWKRYVADPALRDSVSKLITVYGDAETLRSLTDP